MPAADDQTADPRRPLRQAPELTAVLLDVDGVLAPIVAEAGQARVPTATRDLLQQLTDRYALVACVSGRSAVDARRVVGLDTITYLGSHGAETLRAGATEPDSDPQVQAWAQRVDAFTAERLAATGAVQRGVRSEHKGAIVALHWRGAPDEAHAVAALRELADAAEEGGLHTQWGRKVLEIRPPVPVDKGTGIRALLHGTGLRQALYAGDDTTDLDAFRALVAMRGDGTLRYVLRVGVASDEGPGALADEADVLLDGTEQVRQYLTGLLNGHPPQLG